MTTNQTFAITFIARTDRKDQKNYNIYVRITIDGGYFGLIYATNIGRCMPRFRFKTGQFIVSI